MTKVSVAKRIAGLRHVPLLDALWGASAQGKRLFERADTSVATFEPADAPEEAAIILVPHNYFDIRNDAEYLRQVADAAKSTGKRLLVMALGDSDEEVSIPNSIVVRNSQYKSRMRKNEVIAPALAEDLGRAYGVKYRKKESAPVVGFCGWAGFPTAKSRAAYAAKVAANMLAAAYHGPEAAARRQGLYFRRKAMKALSGSPAVKTSFVVRDTYSGHASTVQGDPALMRREYVANMSGSDLVLAPKGDGNYSMRFYEALSLGRVPLLIDTDMVLPREDDIDYSKFVLRVPFEDIGAVAERAAEWYAGLDDREFEAAQRRAREAFESKLSFAPFYKDLFARIERGNI